MTRPDSALRLAATAALGLALAASLAGFGKLGRLERPGPMFGHASGADAGPSPAQTVHTVDPRDPNSDPSPSRQVPIDTGSNPGSTPPPGALENPYARPK